MIRTRTSGLFVAATIVTPDNSCIPSISFNMVVNIPSCAAPSLLVRDVANASISSYDTISNSEGVTVGKAYEKYY